jgi:hypothetical protein
MAYTTSTEIESDFKDVTFTTTSNVKTADVTQFIAESDALINSYVGKKYTTPVTSGEGLTLLKLLSRSLVTARIKRLMEVKQEKNSDANQNILGVLLSPTAVMKILSDIKDGTINLDGAALLVSDSGFYSENYQNDVEFVAKKSERQW